MDKNTFKYEIFDSHAHYDDSSFDEDREDVISELKENNVVGVLNCGSSMEGAVASLELSKNHDFFYAAVGIHPEYADMVDESVIEKLREMCKFHKVRAIGEIGLDYYYEENPEREIQRKAFRRQMKLAKELRMPVIIHDRDAHEDTLTVMKEYPEVIGVVHCFSGSVEFARQCLSLGYYIGFTGVVTFKNAKKILEVAKAVPVEKMLVETDCPYMAPTPHRGKRNRSEHIEYILDTLSQIKDISVEELGTQFVRNIKVLLNLC